jgi:glycosyltransferase involved in cell wall biosynthesis
VGETERSTSVAICTYNGEPFLQEQLDSIALQSRSPQELVVCDDGSTDSTLEIIEKFSRSVPFSVRVFRNSERLGSTRNFQNAISCCKGDYIALADQDDLWDARKLALLAAHLEGNPHTGAIFSDAELIDEHSTSLGKSLWQSIPFHPVSETLSSRSFQELLLRQDVVTGATLVFRSALLPEILPIPEGWVHDSWIAWIAVLYSSLAFSSEPLIKYRVHSNQQIGVAKESIATRVHKIHSAGNSQYSLIERRFTSLKERVLATPSGACKSIAEDLDGKIRHASYQASLPSNKALRAVQIAKAWPLYRRYTRGLVTAVRDLMA